ncbi:MAG: hypothetical protein J6V25_00700 [Oscillospiraceae bacterium]|nr:hypothetical protein [Oscillospiraceae bacterium]
MTTMFVTENTVNRWANSAACTSVRIRPVEDAVLILAVSVLVCLQVLAGIV